MYMFYCCTEAPVFAFVFLVNSSLLLVIGFSTEERDSSIQGLVQKSGVAVYKTYICIKGLLQKCDSSI